MLIKIGPDLRILDDLGGSGAFPTASAFGYFFHEYTHFLHNISTVSGIAAFINTVELWRCFRRTVDRSGYSAGSATCDADRRRHLQTLIAYLTAARRNNRPPLTTIVSPVSITITSLTEDIDVQGPNQNLLSVLTCDVNVSDQSGRTEEVKVRVGTLELLESAAWLLERRMVIALNPQETISSPPIFPYRVVEAVAHHAARGLEEEGILVCILTALQSSDAPQALKAVFEIADLALRNGNDPVPTLRQIAINNMHQCAAQLDQAFATLEKEFSNDGVLARAIRRVIGAARRGFELRRADPIFEFRTIERIRSSSGSLADVIRSIPSCAILQIRYGGEDQIGRDILGSFLPNVDEYGQDPEGGLRTVHSAFDYIGRHRTETDLTNTQHARPGRCPFYTCCNLPLRKQQPNVCQSRPWESADWPEWEGGACWYGTGVRITRPPQK